MPTNFHDFHAIDIKGRERFMGEFAGKVVLVVNTASACGLTPQYAGLQKLQEKFPDDLVVLGFPCNQFGAQEPGSEEQIATFCDLNFHVTFPMFSKIDVNGDDTHPIFQYLKTAEPGVLGSEPIKWNFTKFLVGRDGNPLKRFAPTTAPEEIEGDIREAIAA